MSRVTGAPTSTDSAPPPPPLLATCWTTAGDATPLSEDERSPHDLLDRIAAAATAGYEGFGFLHADLLEGRTHHSWQRIRRQLHELGVAHVEVEFLTDWFATGTARAVSDDVRRTLLEAARELGAHHVKVGGSFTDTWPGHDPAVGAFRELCDDAAAHGTRVALEPMPFSSLPDIHAARRVVEDAGHDHGGLLLDVWHVAHSDVSVEAIAALPQELIVGVELNDSLREVRGSMLEDTIHRRLLCGEGELDLTGFIRAVVATGFDGAWGVEIISQEHRSRPLDEQCVRSFETARAQLTAAVG